MASSSDSHSWVLEAVDLYELPLQRYAHRLLGDFDLAADAVQHAFVKLCEESHAQLEGRVAPWLFRVCRNKALDHLRKADRERTLDDDPAGGATSPVRTAASVDPAVGDASAAAGGEPLKYQSQLPAAQAVATDPNAGGELLTVKLRWKRPDGDTSTLLEVPFADRRGAFDAASADLRFAAAVAAFGMILRESDQQGEATLPLVAKIAAESLGRDEGGYRAEFLDLVRRAESL